MQMWRDNRVDAPFEMSAEEIADAFMASGYAASPMPLERSLRLFIAADLHGTWEDEDAFANVFERTYQKWV